MREDDKMRDGCQLNTTCFVLDLIRIGCTETAVCESDV